MTAFGAQAVLAWKLDNARYTGDSEDRIRQVEKFGEDLARASSLKADHSYQDVTGIEYSLRHQGIQNSDLLRYSDRSDTPGLEKRYPSVPLYRYGSSLSPICEWEGYVTSKNEKTFFVNLANVKDGSGLPIDQAEFELRELSEAERKRLEVGSIVRWVIGFERSANDQRRKVSRIHVRRLPVFKKEEIEVALRDAEDLINSITWDTCLERESN